MPFEISTTVIALDLDDTLYLERDYVASGRRFVADKIKSLYPEVSEPVLRSLVQHDGDDWIGNLCAMLNFPREFGDSLLWLYRLHEPNISLDQNVADFLKLLCNQARAVVIVTDGRGVTQRLKLRSLGLMELPAFISEEYGSPKPEPERFVSIQTQFPADHYVYIGDNPAKDFIAPNNLGWITVCIRPNGPTVHSQTLDGLPPVAYPRYWIDQWSQFFRLVC